MRDDRGQTTVEWLGIGAVSVAVIVAFAVFGPSLTQRIQSVVDAEICRAATDDDCDAGVAVPDLPVPVDAEMPEPPAAPVDLSRPSGLGGAQHGGSVADQIEQNTGEELSALDCELLATRFGPRTCPQPQDHITDDDIRTLVMLFGGEDGELNELACATSFALPRSDELARACGILRAITGTTAGDELIAALDDASVRVIDALRMLPLAGSAVDALEIAMDESVEGDELNAGDTLLRLVFVLGEALPADEVADIVNLIRRGDDAAAAARIADHAEDVADDATRLGDDVRRVGDGAADDVVADLCSFPASTPVVMADGSTLPIADVQVGDRVTAGDPEHGRWQARPVTGTWVHADTFVDIPTAAGPLTTTADHRIWDAGRARWVAAASLGAGDLLVGPGGQRTTVTAPMSSSAQRGPAFNLTVEDLHSYLVEVAGRHILVHNDCTVPGGGLRAHEDLGGHTLERHVGKADEQLVQRVQDKPGLRGASSFPDEATAEQAIGQVLERHADDLDDFVASGEPTMIIEGRLGQPTGRHVASGTSEATEVSGLEVFVVADAAAPDGYRVHTAYPVP